MITNLTNLKMQKLDAKNGSLKNIIDIIIMIYYGFKIAVFNKNPVHYHNNIA